MQDNQRDIERITNESDSLKEPTEALGLSKAKEYFKTNEGKII